MGSRRLRDIEGGGLYVCEDCGKEFFVSWERNPCQCCGCSDDNDHKCESSRISDNIPCSTYAPTLSEDEERKILRELKAELLNKK